MELLMCDSNRFPAFRLLIFMLIAISQTSGFTIAARDKDLKQGPKAPDLLVGASDILPTNLNNKSDNDTIIKSIDKNESSTTTPLPGSKNNTQVIKLTNVMSVSKNTRSEPKTVENKTLLDNKSYPSNSVIGDEKLIKQTEKNGKDTTIVSVTMPTNNTNTSDSDVRKIDTVPKSNTTSSILNVSELVLQDSENTTSRIENKTKNINESKKITDNKTYSTNSVISDKKEIIVTKTNLKGDTGIRPAKVSVTTILNVVNNESFGSTTEKLPRELIPWKIYKTIERKTTSTEPTEFDNIPAKSATVEDIVSHDENTKNLEVSTIPDIRLDETTRSTLPIEMLLSSTQPMRLETTTENIPTQKKEILTEKVMSSKRGGFLDLANPRKDNNKGKSNEDEKGQLLDNATDQPTTVKHTETKSEFLMNEAAIRDELLMEKVISEKEETAIRYAEELESKNENYDSVNDQTAETDDKNRGPDLRVQPIAKSLYEVNPNYRRMKKIDVVPAKPFVRDPDDNTWRNESLSSMGIVFKAKNSSKSFTEVIKSRTENELSNVFGEGGDKADQPALRDRLEQLAEMRKTKKKKTEKGDEPVNETEPTTETFKVIENYSTTVKTVTVNPSSMRVISAEKVRLEYFETPDDETIEYFEQPQQRKINNAKPSSDIPNRKPNVNYIDPNRKATIQYFPPKPEPVSVNEYDTSFGNKMELFTDNNHNLKAAKTTTRPDTVSSTPIDDDYLDSYKKVYTSTHNALFSNHFYRPTQMTRPQSTSYFVNNDNMHTGLEGFKVVMAEVGKDDDGEVEHQRPARLRGYIAHKVATEPEAELNIIDKIIKGSQAVDLNMANKHHLHGFPILYNNSVVHTENSGKALASSTSFLRRDIDQVKPITRPKNILKLTKKFDAIRDRFSVDLTQPSYELHYFLPEHEHNEEA